MKFKQALVAAAAVAGLSGISTSANALAVLDGWQLQTSAGTTTNIGHLNLSGGGATVFQEVNGAGNVFVGAKFQESGNIFSITYTAENSVGSGDTGAPAILSNGLVTITFSNVAGHVVAPAGTGFRFVFDSGSYTITSGADSASGSIIGLDGTLASSSTITGTTGATTLLGNILASAGTFVFRDNTGASVMPALAADELFVQVTTTNNVNGASGVGPCPFTPSVVGNSCATVVATSEGALNLAELPEPGSLALAGLALLAVGGATSRARKSKA